VHDGDEEDLRGRIELHAHGAACAHTGATPGMASSRIILGSPQPHRAHLASGYGRSVVAVLLSPRHFEIAGSTALGS
jgi:hypothetical protein